MKIYMSADIEGVTGVMDVNETVLGKPEYNEFREQMIAEVGAACQGAFDAGAKQIVVKDAHAGAQNVIGSKLPHHVALIRGWSGHPYSMMEHLDSSFDAVILIGYHACATSSANPLSHTISGGKLHSIKINGKFASEFLINAYTAALHNIPVVFVSGDKGLCEEVKEYNAHIATYAVKEGYGKSVISVHPTAAVDNIRQCVTETLQKDIKKAIVELPEKFSVEVTYKNHATAYEKSFYPNAFLKDSFTVSFQTVHYFEVLRFFQFVI